MFQRKIDEIFVELPSIFGLADDVLGANFGNDCTDYDRRLQMVPQIFRKENLKLNKQKCCFRCTNMPFLEKLFLGMT